MLGALLVSSSLKAIDKVVEHMGERHPASSFWPAFDRYLDNADAVFGWFGDLMKNIVFTRKML